MNICCTVRQISRNVVTRQAHYTVRLVGVAVCIALLMGCASVTMQKVSLVSAPRPNTALVTFVRPAVFFGKAVGVDIWDGESFIGVLRAGTLLQYEAEPGEHLFLANAENWSYIGANLMPGRRYYIKANVFPGILFARVALAPVPKTDAHIEEWLSNLNPMSAPPGGKQAVESKKKNDIGKAVKDFKEGKVTSGELRPEDGL